jgi:hypothetical protein
MFGPRGGMFDPRGEIKKPASVFTVYRNWMNSLGVNPHVNYLYTDLYDGLILFQGSISQKTPFRQKTFRINFHPQVFDSFPPPKKQQIYSYPYIMD